VNDGYIYAPNLLFPIAERAHRCIKSEYRVPINILYGQTMLLRAGLSDAVTRSLQGQHPAHILRAQTRPFPARVHIEMIASPLACGLFLGFSSRRRTRRCSIPQLLQDPGLEESCKGTTCTVNPERGVYTKADHRSTSLLVFKLACQLSVISGGNEAICALAGLIKTSTCIRKCVWLK
jgi:hypothetical protein